MLLVLARLELFISISASWMIQKLHLLSILINAERLPSKDIHNFPNFPTFGLLAKDCNSFHLLFRTPRSRSFPAQIGDDRVQLPHSKLSRIKESTLCWDSLHQQALDTLEEKLLSNGLRTGWKRPEISATTGTKALLNSIKLTSSLSDLPRDQTSYRNTL